MVTQSTRIAASLLAAAMLLMSCEGSPTGTPDTGAPASIAVVSGDSQAALRAHPFPAPVVVVVKDAAGNPVVDVAVTFTPEGSAGGVVTDTVIPTDSLGRAQTSWRALGSSVGRVALRAAVAGIDSVLIAGYVAPDPAEVAAGGSATCVVARLPSPAASRDTRVFCWGADFLGGADHVAPVLVDSAHGLAQLAMGDGWGCGLDVSRTAWCWGRNDQGQLGDGTRTPSAAPVRVAGSHTFQQLAAGRTRTCGLEAQAGGSVAVACWGAADGASGSLTPVVTSGPQGELLGMGEDYWCTGQSGVNCWGSGPNGELGCGPGCTSRYDGPVRVAGDYAISIEGGHTTCMVTSDLHALCWGKNDVGQAGDGDPGANRLSPAVVSGGLQYSSVAVTNSAEGAVCAGTAGSSPDIFVYCWGDNRFGQLGRGIVGGSVSVPVRVRGVLPFGAPAAGDDHVCVVDGSEQNSGSVFCWGRNHHHQLGDGTTRDRGTLVRAYPFYR
jgi:hypothetical protein